MPVSSESHFPFNRHIYLDLTIFQIWPYFFLNKNESFKCHISLHTKIAQVYCCLRVVQNESLQALPPIATFTCSYVKLFDYFSNQADISIQNNFKHNIYSYIPSGKASFKDIVVVWVVISVIHGPTSAWMWKVWVFNPEPEPPFDLDLQ